MDTPDHTKNPGKAKKILSAFKKKKVWIPSAIILLILIISLFSGGKGSSASTVVVERGTVVSQVSLTGKIKPSQSVDLAFEKSGRLQTIRVAVGEKVTSGQTLLELDNADAYSQVAQAQAQYNAQLARLRELEKGASPETLAVSRTALQNAYQAALDALYDAQNKAQDAVRSQTDEFFLYDEEPSPEVTFNSTDVDSRILASQYRHQSGIYLNELHAKITSLSTQDTEGVSRLVTDMQGKIKYFLSLFSYIDAALTNANGVTSETRAAYKAYITAGRTELNSALSAISTKEQAIETAQKNLALQEAGSTKEELAYQEAQVAQTKANVQYAQSQLSKTVIRAPFPGTITKIPYGKGDIVQPQSTAVSIIGSGAYQIETNVTESDVAKIHVGDVAQITLDAYTSDVIFQATVVQIDLSETIIDGVPTYKTTLQLSEEDERIISGMTANIDIVSDKKENVLYVPTRNIRTEDGKKFVQKVTGESQFEEIQIQTGLRGSDGRSEIVSGLQEGDLIATE